MKTTSNLNLNLVEDADNVDIPEHFNANFEKLDGVFERAKNLFHLVETQTKEGVTLTSNGNGSYTLSGTCTKNGYFYLLGSNFSSHSSNYDIGAGTYTMQIAGGSDTTYNLRARVIKEGDVLARQKIIADGSATFNVNEGERIVVFLQFFNGVTYDNVTVFPQLELGTIATKLSVPISKGLSKYFVPAINTLLGRIETLSVDYIVEQGTNGVWTYEKWASGKVKCWGVYTTTATGTASSVFGHTNTYNFIKSIPFPSGLFSDKTKIVPNVNVIVGTGYTIPVSIRVASVNSMTVEALSNVSGEQTCSYYCNITGTWK